ncbi:hypothetical protein [Pseudomonas baltica]|uniref:hypothetical protein n=1 Tax=Pseudomonas baltica TaxID=2762576 RepID=UPI00289D488D|nr:hypothetical protein [Pseudomonas baltica]
MRRMFGLTDEDLFKLQRADEAIALVQALAQQTNEIGVYQPKMLAGFLDLVREDLGRVICSATGKNSISQ